MLFRYPSLIAGQNWLHECTFEIIKLIHTNIDSNISVPRWPDIIPIAHRAKLKRKHGLKSRIKDYADTLARISPPKRAILLSSLNHQGDIGNLLNNTLNPVVAQKIPAEIRPAVESLSDYLYSMISNEEFQIRHKHYIHIYSNITDKVCPFCGCEPFDAPGAPSEDFDHYLAKSLYPFASANLNNLAPSGGRCNRSYKKQKNIVLDATRQPRVAFNPYTTTGSTFSLDNSIPFAPSVTPVYIQSTEFIPTLWNVEFNPHTPECDTWDAVYEIKTRIIRDTLEPNFKKWLQAFIIRFKKNCSNQNIGPSLLNLKDELSDYISSLEQEGMLVREFIRPAVFRMVLTNVNNDNKRLINFILDY